MGGCGEYGVDTGIGVVVGDAVDAAKVVEVVFVGYVVTVPGDDVVGAVGVGSLEECVSEFVEYGVRVFGFEFGGLVCLGIVVSGGSEKVACVGESVGSYGS